MPLMNCGPLKNDTSPGVHKSNWTDQEMGFVMGRGMPIFAVYLGHAPYGFIGRFQAFNGLGKTPYVLGQVLFDAFRKHDQTKAKISRILVRLFEKSPSYEAAKLRIGYLEEMETWDPSYSERIAAASKDNGQIADAFGVPARVNKLITKWELKEDIPF
jgi:hypothetical protein